MPNMLQTYLFFVVLPVVLGFSFNFVALYVILNADLGGYRRRASRPPATRSQRLTQCAATPIDRREECYQLWLCTRTIISTAITPLRYGHELARTRTAPTLS